MIKKVKFFKEKRITMPFLEREKQKAYEENNMRLFQLISNLIKLRKKQKLYKLQKRKRNYAKK